MQTAPSSMAGATLNLQRLAFLLVDDNPLALDLVCQIMLGLGAGRITRCDSAGEALAAVSANDFDLVIADAQMEGMDGFELIRKMRREARPANRAVPVILVSGHSRQSDILKARDCGANFVIAKPLTPKVLVERIIWLGRDERPFIDCDAYVGPDRRFKNLGPPLGAAGRRADDVNAALGEASSPNLSQDEIDAFLKPAKVNI